MPIHIAAGGTADIDVGMPQETRNGTIGFELSDPPEGIALRTPRPTVWEARAWSSNATPRRSSRPSRAT